MSSSGSTRSVASTAYVNMRATARRLGLGRLRTRIQRSVHASPHWIAVPPRRLKDLDADRVLPPNAIALTFDDGPNPDVTPQLLRVLDLHSARATFFMCGLAAQRHPELVRAVLAAGHTIGGHTWDHRHKILRDLSAAEWRRQIDDTHQLLADLSGAAVRYFRPPRGKIDRYAWDALRKRGITTVLWSADGSDCRLRDPDVIAAKVMKKLWPGTIALLHDSNANFLSSTVRPHYGELGNQESTLQAVEIILRTARERGLEPISLDTLPDLTMGRTGRPRLVPYL